MELLQLRYFLEVAKSQHMTKTAEKLHIAQPALTQSIRRLEQDLGVSLFSREGRNIQLTPCGMFFYNRLQLLVEELDRSIEDVRQMAQAESRTVRLNVLAASTLVIDAVAAYKKIHKDVNFQLLQREDSGFYDIGVSTRLFYQPPEEAEGASFVCTEKILLAVPKTGIYPKKASADLSDFRDAPFISLFGSKQLRSICDKFCAHAGFVPRIIFESDSPAAVKNMIAENMGVGFWPEFSWDHDTGTVRLLEITQPPCQRDILITCPKADEASETVKEFYVFLKEYFQKRKQAAERAKTKA